MSELINNKTVFSLLEVTKSIQKTIQERYKHSFWVMAEMNKLNYYAQSGHCYPELVEKSNGKVIAQIRANLWKSDYDRIQSIFLKVLHEPLKDGIKIMFQAKISFDPAYGLALQIIDIDPSYTLGDLEKEKLETITKLKQEGIYSRNKELRIPLLPQRIAIISVSSSKGYADFTNVIDSNPWHYKIFYYLFPSLLQGEKAVDSIIGQLNAIRKVIKHFDVVAIMRGGGGDVGLSCYNNYRLAKEIALFPIPVITGIGHSTNETVSEMISHSNAITPTKLAEYLIQKFHNFSVPLQKAEEKIINWANYIIAEQKSHMQSAIKLFRSVTINLLNENRSMVDNQAKSLFLRLSFVFKSARDLIDASSINLKRATHSYNVFAWQGLNAIEKNIQNMSPESVLKRGYSITLLNNKAIVDSGQLHSGDIIETLLHDGSIESVVKKTKKRK